MTSSTHLRRSEDETICGGLSMNMATRDAGSGKLEVLVPITNMTEFGWRGTVRLQVGNVAVPVRIGEIPPGATREDKLVLRLRAGTDHQLDGSLLIGP